MTTHRLSLLCVLSLSACDLASLEDTGPDVGSCALSEDMESLFMENAEAQILEAVFVGQATHSTVPEYLYAISLYNEMTIAGWMIFAGCPDEETIMDPTCGGGVADEEIWSCVQPTCLDASTLQIETWYTSAGSTELGEGEEFSLDLSSTGGTVRFWQEPVHRWTVASSSSGSTLTADHEVLAEHLGLDGRRVDVSYTVSGLVQRGAAHPIFSLLVEYPALEPGHLWTLRLDMDEEALSGTVYRDGERVGRLQDTTREGEHHLRLDADWEGCAAERSRPTAAKNLSCDPLGRADCDPNLK